MERQNQTQLDLLSMMYDQVAYIAPNMIYCRQDNDVKVVDNNNAELMKGTTDNLKIYKNFFCAISDDKLSIYSTKRNINKDIKILSKYDVIQISELYDNFIQIKTNTIVSPSDFILNTALEQILNLSNCMSVRTYSLSSGKFGVSFYSRNNFITRSRAVININSEKLECYDSFEIDEKNSLIATKCRESGGTSINQRCINNFLYKLAYNGAVVSENEYEDIVKTSSLSSTNYLMTIALDDKITKRGIIRNDGLEILPAKYDDIQYLGNEDFMIKAIVNKKQYFALFNTKIGTRYEFGIIESYSMHSLPILILKMTNGDIKIYNCLSGEIINVEDLPKKFNCSYCKSNPEIIKVKLEYGVKYITNRLVSITNIHEISKMQKEEWIKM